MGLLEMIRDSTRVAAVAGASLHEIYRPILRAYFLVFCAYYTLMFGLNWLAMEHDAGFAALQSATLLASVFSGTMGWATRHALSPRRIELAVFVMNLLVIANVCIALSINFLPGKLTYFIIISMIFALASTSTRLSAVSIVVALIALATFMDRLDTATSQAFGFLTFATAMSSLAIAIYLRKAIARIARANREAHAQLAEAQTLSAAMREQSLSDSLTGLPNRRAFFVALAKVVDEQASAEDQSSVEKGQTWLVLLDLDGFKAVNDVHGHKTGDQLLIAIAERLRAFVKDSAHVSRMGGDEFNIILRGVASEDELRERCDGLLQTLAKPYILEGRQIRISCSAGCFEYDLSQPSDTQISNADYALMVAKKMGKNQVVVFDAEHEGQATARSRIEAALRNADLEQEISIVFQPQVRLGDDEVVGAEVLARWVSPLVGEVPPHRFIKIAEESGLVANITLVVVEKALRELKGWDRPLPLSINLSVHDLMSDPVVDQIIDLITRHDVSPALIEFEVTETAMMADAHKAAANLIRLSEAGFSIALDDFGTGYSNFSYLRSLPIKRLKVDRSFVEDPGDPMAEKVLASLVGMARVLGVNCLLEGVEDEISLLMAKRAGAELVQGYLFAKPMSAADMRDQLVGQPPRLVTRGADVLSQSDERRSADLNVV